MSVNMDAKSVSQLSLESDYLTKCRAQIARYVAAKDNNKAHLMPLVFTADARLMMQVSSENIHFPAQLSGCENITDTLVRRFNENYENVYTLCFSDSLYVSGNLSFLESDSSINSRVSCSSLSGSRSDFSVDNSGETLHKVPQYQRQVSTHNTLSCLWLVCMVDKVNQQIKLGSGRYHWQFESTTASLQAPLPKVSQLTIEIAEMSLLPISQLELTYQWVSEADYPWCMIEDFFTSVSSIDQLKDVESVDYLRQQVSLRTSR